MLVGALGVGRAHAQSGVVWEQMPLFADRVNQVTNAVGWLVGDGTADPALDTLVIFHSYGVFRYAPGESNGEWDPWHQINGWHAYDGLVTSEGSILFVPVTRRSTDAGLTWEGGQDGLPQIMEVTLPWMRAAANGRAVLISASASVTEPNISYADGEAGSWIRGGPASAYLDGLGEVPPSPALPLGRLLSEGSYVRYSDDGGMTWVTAALGGQPAQSYLSVRFAFYPISGHAYGGAVFATGCEYIQCDSAGYGTGDAVDLFRSDDGGASWALVHHFTGAEVGLPIINGSAIESGVPYVGPDGALWAGVSRRNGGDNPGRIMRSTDEGLTWHRADAGLAESNGGLGWRIYKLHTARDGRMYAATDRGVWRTTQPIVAAEAPASPASDLSLTVLPNPATGAVTVSVASPSTLDAVTIEILDALGRRVAVVHAGPLGAGERTFALDASAWAPGVYTARAQAGGEAQTARFTVAR